jgi:hypothetical protein
MQTGLSKDPAQIRRRLRRAAGNPAKLDRDYKMLAEHPDTHHKPLEDWDYEELARGRPRSKDGRFGGGTPSWVTLKVQQEAKERLRTKAYGDLARYAGSAVKVLVNLMRDTDVENRIRLDAAKYLLDQVIGKAKVFAQLEGKLDVQAFLAEALVMPDGSPAHPVIDLDDGEWSEDDDEPK